MACSTHTFGEGGAFPHLIPDAPEDGRQCVLEIRGPRWAFSRAARRLGHCGRLAAARVDAGPDPLKIEVDECVDDWLRVTAARRQECEVIRNRLALHLAQLEEMEGRDKEKKKEKKNRIGGGVDVRSHTHSVHDG